MSFVAVAVGASTALGAIGAATKGASQQQADQYNANVKMQQAQQAEAQATEEARISRVQSGQMIGQEKANYGASGVSGASGSVHDVLSSSAANAEMDALNIQHKGDMQAWALETGASQDRAAGDNAQQAGQWGVASSKIGRASCRERV